MAVQEEQTEGLAKMGAGKIRKSSGEGAGLMADMENFDDGLRSFYLWLQFTAAVSIEWPTGFLPGARWVNRGAKKMKTT